MSDKKRRPTRNDVANLAGVSPGVVSFVLNNSNYVSEEKRAAVLDAIETLGYYPNVLARGLKTKKTSQIAVICDNIVYNEWLRKLEQILFEKNFYVTMCYSQPTDEFLQMILQRQYDGIYLQSNSFNERQLNQFVENGPPMVLFKTKPYKELSKKIAGVSPNYADGIAKAVDLLAFKGHKRIGFIPPLRFPTNGLKSTDFRSRSYLDGLERNNLIIDERYFVTSVDTEESIKEVVFNLLTRNSKDRPTALIVCNDYLAALIVSFVGKLGMKVPDDLAIIGSDNNTAAKISSPMLTTIDFSKELFARSVTDSLLSLMQGEIVEDIMVPTNLVIRDST